MVKRYIRPSTATADTAVRHLDNHDETVMHALVTAGAFVALADGRVQAIERDELVNFVDRQGFIPSISRHEIAEAFDNRVRQLQNGDSADVLAETLRPLAGLSLASVVIRTATKVAAADRYIHPGESRALQLIRLVLAAAQDPSKYVVTDELREAAGQESHGVWKPSKDVTAALTDVLRAGAPAPPAPEIQLIYETAPIGLAFLTPDCRYVLINHHMTEICGISVADHVGRSVRETVPQVADQVEEIVRTILRTRQPIVGIEINGQRPDGGNAQRCWITYWHPLKNKDGSIAGINVAAEEITERKRSEAALAVAEQRYRALVRATSSLVWTTSADGQVLDIPEWRTYTGQSVEQAKGWGWLAALHPDDREHTAVVWQKAVDTRSLYETEYRIRRSDGVYIWHKARGVAIIEDDESIREWVGICLDIDVRKRATERQIEAEKALRDLNQWLEQRVEAEAQERSRIWNVSQDLLVVGDTKGRIISVNPAWAETLGWSEDELRLKSGEWLVHPNDLEKSQNEQISLVEGRNTRHFENRIRDKQGKYHVVSWRAVPDQGRIYAVGRDVTELQCIETYSNPTRWARLGRSTMSAATAAFPESSLSPLPHVVAPDAAWLQ